MTHMTLLTGPERRRRWNEDDRARILSASFAPGAVVADVNHQIGIPFQAFYSDLREIVKLKDVANGVFKSFCFALIIGAVSCHQGLATIGGPRGIGRSVTKAVVNSIVLIVIFDYILTRFLLQ